MDQNLLEIEKTDGFKQLGTLAIDLGNSTTVVAFQGQSDDEPRLLDLPPITRSKGEIPTLVWKNGQKMPYLLIGEQVNQLNLIDRDYKNVASDFKRWIGAPHSSELNTSNVLPEEAGKLLIHKIWELIPPEITIKRLVLTAPVETYRNYRSWLNKVCADFSVDEIALVDEPTAAAMGAGLEPGTKLLVIDIGGSTIDMSLVALEGGEGKADPIAQLVRFEGESLEDKGNQILRCAKVLGKAGQRIGGRDLDRWIANYLFPNAPLTELLLNKSEKLKCRLSDFAIDPSTVLTESIKMQELSETIDLKLSRIELEKLLIERGFLKCLNSVLEKTLANGRANGCELKSLKNVVLVGGGARIPLVRDWLKNQINPIPLLTPPPIEAVVKGALSLTPGVKIRDVLQRGASLRCWDQKRNKHIWHPIFVAGQPWPTTKPFEIVLASSKVNQTELEIKISEPEIEGINEVIYVKGIPTVKSASNEIKLTEWPGKSISIDLNPPGQLGEDCLRLKFKIDNQANLIVEGIDLRNNKEIEPILLGKIN